MKRLFKKKQKIVKGMSSAVLLSIAIHAALFFLAGMLVVFTVVKKREVEFEPPKAVERPKMKLKKPKVKIKKTSKPKPTTRIVTKMNRASMPDIQLPEMSGMGEGLSGGIGGFEIMPDFSVEGLFGGEQSIGNDFVGTFYDLQRGRNGRPALMDPGKFIQEMRRFVQSGWDTSRLSRYYRSQKKLYTTTFAIPPVQSVLAPQAFGEPEASSYCFAVHYEGELVHREDIKFRFWGLGDDILIVRVNGEIVLNAPYPRTTYMSEWDTGMLTPGWQTSSAKSRSHWLGCELSVVGDWIELKGGESKDMEVLIGEVPGGLFQAMLVVEVEGEEYERSPDRSGPILPIFKTAVSSIDLVETIHADLDPNDACVTNGPVFCDYEVENITYYDEVQIDPPMPELYDKNDRKEARKWTSLDGRSLEAEFMAIVAGNVVLKSGKGKQLKIPAEQLSPEDRQYVELANPPEFQINFSKKSNSIPRPKLSPYEGSGRPLQISDFTFGARLKKSTTKPYSHELKVEFFAFGEEIDGDNYVLLDRQQSTFSPSGENKGSHEFYSPKPIRLQATAMRAASPMRGTKYGGFLITITDERGEIIQYKTSHKWLFECLETLKKLPVGKHFDKRGIRVGPPRPTRADRPGWV
ncbi:MAG: SHD1 domain-containing protein [Verrucomicrobiota bacterium]